MNISKYNLHCQPYLQFFFAFMEIANFTCYNSTRRGVIMLGRKLKKIREENKKTQDDLAQYLSIKRQTYSAYERGISMPDALTLSKLADYFNVSTDYLLGRCDTEKIETIAAHHDGNDYTDEELEEIERFKEFVKMKRIKKK